MTERLLTSAEWEPIANIKVHDPDGWDRGDFARSWAEPITEAEFRKRAAPSTVQTFVSYLQQVVSRQSEALDYIATRVTDDDYDNPSSALEAIGDRITSTGRVIVQREY